MSRERAIEALAGVPVRAHALTWTQPQVLRQLTWGSGIENEPEALQAIAQAFSLDLVFIDGAVKWASEAVARLHEDDIAAAWTVAGVLGQVADAHGWYQTLSESASEPGELAFALDEALHQTLRAVRAARAAGADVLVIADELASTAGWLVSPDFALEALLPCYSRAVAEWPDVPAVFHSDGDIRALYGPLRRVGFAGVHLALPDPEHLTSSAAAARAAGLCPVGGLTASGLHSEGARRSAEFAFTLAHDAPFVFADDGGMTSPEEVAAFGAAMDAVRHLEEGRGES